MAEDRLSGAVMCRSPAGPQEPCHQGSEGERGLQWFPEGMEQLDRRQTALRGFTLTGKRNGIDCSWSRMWDQDSFCIFEWENSSLHTVCLHCPQRAARCGAVDSCGAGLGRAGGFRAQGAAVGHRARHWGHRGGRGNTCFMWLSRAMPVGSTSDRQTSHPCPP